MFWYHQFGNQEITGQQKLCGQNLCFWRYELKTMSFISRNQTRFMSLERKILGFLHILGFTGHWVAGVLRLYWMKYRTSTWTSILSDFWIVVHSYCSWAYADIFHFSSCCLLFYCLQILHTWFSILISKTEQSLLNSPQTFLFFFFLWRNFLNLDLRTRMPHISGKVIKLASSSLQTYVIVSY